MEINRIYYWKQGIVPVIIVMVNNSIWDKIDYLNDLEVKQANYAIASYNIINYV